MSQVHQCLLIESDDRDFSNHAVPGANLGRDSRIVATLRQIALALVSATFIAAAIL